MKTDKELFQKQTDPHICWFCYSHINDKKTFYGWHSSILCSEFPDNNNVIWICHECDEDKEINERFDWKNNLEEINELVKKYGVRDTIKNKGND